MMPGMKAMALAAGFGLLGAGCVQSALNPTDKVALTGTALKEDKTPLASAELVLERSGNSACVLPAAFSKPMTDAQGAFSQELTGSETQNGDIARCFRLSLPAGAQGASAWTEFLVQVTDVKVPALQQWNGAVSATATNTGVELKFTDLSSTHGLNGLGYLVEAKAGKGLVWSRQNATSPVAFDDFQLEDFAVTASAIATNPVKGGSTNSGTTFNFRYQSDAATFPARAKVPASRGAPCAYTSAPAVCPLTDGKLDNVQFGNGIPELTVTLAAPKALTKVVLRGAQFTANSTVVLEGSTDGLTWRGLATVEAGVAYQALVLTAGTPVSQIRLKGTRTDSGTFGITSLDELSLFE
ncbi:MAG: discoidin domain-containing protein [Myxococcaceae bacterium]